MEAIVFAYGATPQQLRAKQLRDLIHRGAAASTASVDCFVELALAPLSAAGSPDDTRQQCGDDTGACCLRRTIPAQGGACQYSVNGRKVTRSAYLQALSSHGLALSRLPCLMVGQHKVAALVNAPGGNLLASIEEMLGTHMLARTAERATAASAVLQGTLDSASSTAARQLARLSPPLDAQLARLRSSTDALQKHTQTAERGTIASLALYCDALTEAQTSLEVAEGGVTQARGGAAQSLSRARGQLSALRAQQRRAEEATVAAAKARAASQLALRHAQAHADRAARDVASRDAQHTTATAAVHSADQLYEDLADIETCALAAGVSRGGASPPQGPAAADALDRMQRALGLDAKAARAATQEVQRCTAVVAAASAALLSAQEAQGMAQAAAAAPAKAAAEARRALQAAQAAQDKAQRRLGDAEAFSHEAAQKHALVAAGAQDAPAAAAAGAGAAPPSVAGGSPPQVSARDPTVRFLQCLDMCKVLWPEHVFGLLGDSVLYLPSTRWGLALNAALRTQLRRTVLVADREAGARVAATFTEHQAGMVTCAILGELQRGGGTHPEQALPRAVKACGGQLAEHAVCVREARFAPVLRVVLGGWLLLPTVQDAVLLRERGLKRNMATADGTVFRASGEVAGGLVLPTASRGVGARFKLTTDSRVLQQGGGVVVKGGPPHPSASSLARALQAASETAGDVVLAQRDLQTAELAVQAATAAAAAAAAAAAPCQAELQAANALTAAKTRALKRTRAAAAAAQQAAAAVAHGAARGNSAPAALQALAPGALLAALQDRVAEAGGERAAAQQRARHTAARLGVVLVAQLRAGGALQAAKAALEKAAAAAQGGEGGAGGPSALELRRAEDAVTAHKAAVSALGTLQRRLAEARHSVSKAAESSHGALEAGALGAAADELAGVQSGAQRLQSTMGVGFASMVRVLSGDPPAADEGGEGGEVEGLKAMLQDTPGDAASDADAVLHITLQQISEALTPPQVECVRGDTPAIQATLARLGRQLGAALALCQRCASVGPGAACADAALGGGLSEPSPLDSLPILAKKLGRSLPPLTCAGAPPSPAEMAVARAAAEALCSAAVKLGGAAAAAARAGAARSKAAQHASNSAAAALQAMADLLHSTEANEVQATLCRITGIALSTHALAQLAIDCAQQRHSTLLRALESVEQTVGDVFAQLSRCGECTLLYARGEAQLYEGGVTLECSPTGHGWRLFSELSGGQQAMAALALLLALQGMHAAPLYILDEVDAALDAEKVCAAAALLQRSVRRGRQDGRAAPLYLVVTHRAPMYQAADMVVGVYGGGRGTCLVHAKAKPKDMAHFLSDASPVPGAAASSSPPHIQHEAPPQRAVPKRGTGQTRRPAQRLLLDDDTSSSGSSSRASWLSTGSGHSSPVAAPYPHSASSDEDEVLDTRRHRA